MASFLGVLKSIWHGVEGAANAVQPFEAAIATIPVVGGPAAIILNAIVAAEKIVPAAGNGAAKKTAVTSLVNAAAPGIDPTTLSTAIDEIVTALNALNAAAAKLPTTAPAPKAS
jgi:hypothetical protein